MTGAPARPRGRTPGELREDPCPESGWVDRRRMSGHPFRTVGRRAGRALWLAVAVSLVSGIWAPGFPAPFVATLPSAFPGGPSPLSASGGHGGAAGPAISSFVADPGIVTEGSSVTLRAVASGVAPLSYSYSGLPGGCRSENTANLTCSPTEAGASNVTVTVTQTVANITINHTVTVTVANVTITQSNMTSTVNATATVSKSSP